MSDLIGQTLGSYRIISQIGAGGMATVYKAYQPSMDRYVAIKVLPPYLSQDEQFAKRFQREAKAVARLEHAHILPVHDYGEAEGITYLVMRFVEGGTLKQRIAQGRLPLSEVSRIIGQIGSALDYAHRLGVIHRDVKPANVLVDDQGNTYLTDFGLARMMEASDQLTASGVGVGTPAYMSPEQGQGVKVDHRSDIYSLGVILYEMVTGHVPYEAETPMAVMLKHISEPLPLPRTINPDVPEPVERVILKALAKDPAHRYQTAGEMVQALTIATRNLTKEPEQPVEGKLGIGGIGIGREEVSLVTRLQRTWAQPRGKALLIGGAAVVLVALGLLLSRLPGQVQITSEQLAVASREATATSAAVAAVPTATSAPAPAATPTAPCRVAYVDKTGSNTADIFVQDCDGSNWQRVTEGRLSTGHEPAWSPDGQRLVFDEMQAPYDPKAYVPTYLYSVNADGSNRTPIISPDGPVEGNFPVWSPDGTRIAWQRGCEIMTIHPDGSDMVTVLAHREMSGAGDPEMCVHRPMWSPDSQRFAFATFPLEAAWNPSIPGPYEYRFYVVNADGTGLTQLASFKLVYSRLAGDAEMSVFWFPNGRQVALEVREGNKTQRYQMNADGTGEMVEIDSIPESWHPWHWPQWDREVQAAAVTPASSSQAAQARAFAEPILQAIADKFPDFQDDFSVPTSGWSQTNAGDGTSDYLNGEFFVVAKPPPSSSPYQCNEAVSALPEVSDFVLEIDGRFVSGNIGDWQIHFRKWFTPDKPSYKHDNLHVGRDSERANFGRCYYKDCSDLVSYSGKAIKGGTEWNHIQIVARGFELAAYANGEPIMYFDDSQYQKDWRAGRFTLVVCNTGDAPLEARWDNLRIWDLSKLPSAAATTSPMVEQARAFAEPVLAAIANRPPDYHDDFNDSSSGWRQMMPPEKGEAGYADGEYFAIANPASPTSDGCNWVMPAEIWASDFVMEIEGRIVSGESPNRDRGEWHTGFRVREKNAYSVRLTSDGILSLGKETVGRVVTLAEVRAAPFKSTYETNRLQIIAKGPQIALYLNGQPVFLVHDDTFSNGIIGGADVCSGNDTTFQVNFDNFKVWHIAPSSLSAEPLTLQAAQVHAFAEPILQAITNRKPDFADDFSKPNAGWMWLGNNERGEPAFTPEEVPAEAFSDGSLTLTVTDGVWGNTWTRACDNFNDFVLQADLTLVNLVNNTNGGIEVYWGIGPGYAYAFGFNLDGSGWHAYKRKPRESDWTILGTGTMNTKVNGKGTPNRLLLVAHGPRFAAYVNDMPLTYFENSDIPAGEGVCNFGFGAAPGSVTISIDNVKAWNLNNVPGLP